MESQLGQDKKLGGGKAEQKARFEVLDRMAMFGSGLSPQQLIDWEWWKMEWDDHNRKEYDTDWGKTFASWMQDVLTKMANPETNNWFSLFIRMEHQRVLQNVHGLRVPGIPGNP